MNFLHLKYLIEVEKYESISKAAQHLYINQPRLSKIIKEIEDIIKGLFQQLKEENFCHRLKKLFKK